MAAAEWLQMIKLVGGFGLMETEPLGALAPKPPLRDGCVPQTPSRSQSCLIGSPKIRGLGGAWLFQFLFDESGDLSELFFQAVDVCLHLVELSVEGWDG